MFCANPIDALDVSIQRHINHPLMRLQRKLSLSSLFVAHGLLVVSHIRERVAVIYLDFVVEEGIAEEIFVNLGHSYTGSLLAATMVPDPTLRVKPKRTILEADVPSQLYPLKNCLFVNRCSMAEETCKNESPN